jgi:hypothetical protein
VVAFQINFEQASFEKANVGVKDREFIFKDKP